MGWDKTVQHVIQLARLVLPAGAPGAAQQPVQYNIAHEACKLKSVACFASAVLGVGASILVEIRRYAPGVGWETAFSRTFVTAEGLSLADTGIVVDCNVVLGKGTLYTIRVTPTDAACNFDVSLGFDA